MIFGKLLVATTVTVMLLPLGAFAKSSKDAGHMRLTQPVQVGSTQLTPGDYKVEWTGTGSQVQVSFVQRGKAMAKTTAKLVDHETKSAYDAVTLEPRKTNAKVDKLDEIDFGNRTEALVFQPNSQPNSLMRTN